MDAGLLNVFHNPRYHHPPPIRNRVHVYFNSILQVLVDQHRVVR